MPIYTVPCTDQSDSDCEESISFFLDLEGLEEEQLIELRKYDATTFTKEQIDHNNLMDDLDEDEKARLAEDEEIRLEMNLEIPSICGACGTSEIRDKEGNNITSR